MKRIAIVMAMLVGASVQASAQPAFSIAGPADISCENWVSRRASNSSTSLEWWALGFVSGVNAAEHAAQGSDFLTGIDAEGMYAWLDNYCRDKPIDLFELAVGKLAIELKTRAHRP